MLFHSTDACNWDRCILLPVNWQMNWSGLRMFWFIHGVLLSFCLPLREALEGLVLGILTFYQYGGKVRLKKKRHKSNSNWKKICAILMYPPPPPLIRIHQSKQKIEMLWLTAASYTQLFQLFRTEKTGIGSSFISLVFQKIWGIRTYFVFRSG